MRRCLRDPPENPFHEVGEHRDVTLLQGVEDQSPHGPHVVWCGRLDGAAAGIRQDDERTAAVVHALLAVHETAALHPGDVVRQPAPLPAERPGERADADPAVVGLGQPDEDVEVGQGQAGIRLEVAVQGRRKGGIEGEPAAPHPLFLCREPRGVVHTTRLPE